MSIDCAFFGFLAGDAEARVSQAGNAWTKLRVGVGRDEAVQWLNVACFGKAADVAAELRKGDRVYVEGTIKMDTWRGNDGQERHGLNVAAFKIERTHRIGRDRLEREQRTAEADNDAAADAPFDDDINIPF
jgi:single-strand DNA-binding protein